MAVAVSVRFLITDGPSKFDLMAALFDGKRVTFTPESMNPIEVSLLSVGLEDGSRESWLIEGHASGPSQTRKFSGYFHSRTRKGWMEFVS